MTATAETHESVSIGTHLMIGTLSEQTWTYTELCKVKTSPELGGTPSQVDITDLSDRMNRGVSGVQANETKEFTANYIPSVYATLSALTGTNRFAVWYGDTVSGTTITPTGSFGKFSFDGQLSVKKNADSVNSPREMTISIVPTSAITVDLLTNEG